MPQPLDTYPLARKWAERFYAVKGWGALAAAPGSPAIEKRRADTLAELAGIAVGRDFLPEVRRALDGGLKALRKAARDAAADTDLDAIDAEILTLKADVAAQGAIAKARIAAQGALGTAEARFRAAAGLCEEGGLRFLEARLKDARAAFGAANDAGTFDDARKLAAAFPADADAAEAHARHYALWADAATVFVSANYAKGPDRDTAEGNRIAARAAALAAARKGDFAAARLKLAAFPGDAQAPDFALAQAFLAKLAEFEPHAATCENVLRTGMDGTTPLKKHEKDGKEAGLKKKDYAKGTQKLTDLLAFCLPRKALAEKLLGYDDGLKANVSFRDAIAAMNLTQTAGNFPAAIAALAAVDNDPALMRENESRTIDKRLEKRVEELVARIPDPAKTQLKDTWARHVQFVKDKKWDEAETAARRILRYMELEGIFGLKEEADRIFARQPATRTYKYLDAYRTEGQAGRFGNARKEIETAMPLLRRLEDWVVLKDEVATLRKALPAAPPSLQADLDKALSDADALALARDPAGAIAALNGFLDGADYAALAAEIADWTAKDKAVARQHARVVKLARLPALEGALDTALAEARKPATDRMAYGESFMALIRHEAALADAQAFAAVRRQVQGVQAAILKAAKARPDLLDPAPATEKSLADAVQAAEDLAVTGKYADATKAFAKVHADCEALARKAAKHFEASDHKGPKGDESNAGHSLDRHGPDVSHADLIRRLLTGTPPNNKTPDEKSYTGASSKFASIQDWLAGRQMAAEAAAAEGIDLDATEIRPPFKDQPIGADYTVDHGKPIDEIFVGRRKTRKQDPTTGALVDDSTYESYEEMSGLTRSYVNFTWEFEVIPDVDWPDPKTGVVTRKDFKARDIAEYEKAWKIRHGTDPVVIPGRWVMMQQYPVAEDWDDVAKTYTKDAKRQIP